MSNNSVLSNWKTVKDLHVAVLQMMRYNLKILFANKFPYFLFVAFAFYVFITIIMVLDSDYYPTERDVFGIMVLPALILAFYPCIFNIQNDQDNKTLELLFGIPNYRYKVWLVRMLFLFVIEFFLILFFLGLGYIALTPFAIFEMALQLMFPVTFMASLAFMFSTLIRNGNGAAATMIIIGLVLTIITGNLGNSEYNIFLNPYELPGELNENVWREIVFYNRLYLVIGTIMTLLAGLFWLQKREKFI